MMRNLLIVFAGLITAYLLYTRQAERLAEVERLAELPPARATQPAPPPKPLEPKSPSSSKAAPSATPSHAPPVPKLVAQPIKPAGQVGIKAPPGAVPFELINGYVIAFGDVLLGRPTVDQFPKSGFIESPPLHLWESHEIPFSIHASLPNPERVLRVIEYFHRVTPMRFIPYTGQKDSIVFAPSEELCLSYVGKVGGNQPIYLDDRCGDTEITHELMHALGFIHEHSRPDRDRFVRVNWQNIQEERQNQFTEVPEPLAEPVKGRAFDMKSVMIYPPTAFAREPGLVTLESLTGEPVAPVQGALSAEDLARLHLLYGH